MSNRSPIRNLSEDANRARQLGEEHYQQSEPFMNLPKFIGMLLVFQGMCYFLGFFGLQFVTFKFVMCMLGLTFFVFLIWCKDVNQWQHEDPNRIDPNMSQEDITNSISKNGIDPDSFRNYKR